MFVSLFSRRHNFVSHGQNCSDMVFVLRSMQSQSDFKNSQRTYIWTTIRPMYLPFIKPVCSLSIIMGSTFLIRLDIALVAISQSMFKIVIGLQLDNSSKSLFDFDISEIIGAWSTHTKPSHTRVNSPHFWSTHPIYEIKKDYSEGDLWYLANRFIN